VQKKLMQFSRRNYSKIEEKLINVKNSNKLIFASCEKKKISG
jgi:hypothetical protein